MVKLSVNIENTSAVYKRFKDFGIEAEKTFKDITKIQAQDMTFQAQSNASILQIHDNGNLIQGIQYFPIDGTGLSYEIVAQEPYSAYHEFGTGTLVEIPEGWGELAIQFKGAGIREVNIPARPFLYPAFKNGSKYYVQDLDKALSDLIKKSNG